MLRAAAPVIALPLQQVIGEHHDRNVGKNLFPQRLPAYALLQQGERLD